MSRKYVPTFLKEQQAESLTQNNTAGQWPGNQSLAKPLTTGNRFSALSEDFPMNRKSSPLVQTSDQMPSVFGKTKTNTVVPGTLASLTATNATNVSESGSKKSFASKFTERQKQVEDPNYKPPEKPLDFKSEDDFPALGGFGAKKPLAVNKEQKPEENKVVLPAIKKSGYADLARGWAKKKEDEEAMELQRKHGEEIERRERELMKSTIVRHTFKQSARKYDDDEEDEENQEEAFSEYSSVSEGRGEEEFISEGDEDQDGEFNPNTTYDRRHKEDLY